MPRQPLQVLIIPFRKTQNSIEYAVFKRSDSQIWQFVAGGVDEGETVPAAATREAFEEAGIPKSSKLIALDSICSMPANVFRDWESWPQGTFIVKEYSFGVEVDEQELILSSEHMDFKWCPFGEALSLLRWDSNKTALWELNERLKIT